MPNEENLIPFTSDQSREEAKKNGRKGGIASGISRRRKRSLREAADLIVSLKVTDKKVKDKLNKMGIDEEDADYQAAVLAGVVVRGMKGDPKAASLLFSLLDDEQTSTNEQAEAHNSLVDAIRNRQHED
jgi:hypothetical protein